MNTILITKSEVPTYLQSGEFHKSLSDDEDHEQQITVPSNTLKADSSVRNNADLHHLLTSLRYWGVSNVQEEVIKYCLSELESPCDDILQEFLQDFPYMEVLISVILARKEDKLTIAVTSGILEIVRNLRGNLVVTFYCCRAAAQAGNLEILQCLHERGGVLDSSVLHAALEGGDKSLVCVQYLRAQGVNWPPLALVTALKTGSKECFHYALQDGCAWNSVGGVYTLYKDQYADLLKYAFQHGCPVDGNAVCEVVRVGAVKCLQVLHEQGCPWHEFACTSAVRHGHLDCLQYLHENGCPWNERTFSAASCHSNMDIITYLYQNSCPWSEQACAHAAYHNQLETLKFLREHGCPWDAETVNYAVNGNHIDCLQYALQHGCPVPLDSCHTAAEKGYLPLLQCLHEAGAPWHKRVCSAASSYGHLSCLQYAHERGAPWDVNTCTEAAKYGHLGCLQYLHDNDCPWDVNACAAAAANGHLDCLQYAHEHGAPWDTRTFHSTWRTDNSSA